MFPGKMDALNVLFAEQEARTAAPRLRGLARLRPEIRRPGRVLAGCLLLYLLGAAPNRLPTLAAGDQKVLTKEQQQQLQRQALELNKEGIQLYRHGRYAAATKRLEQALAIHQRLYPKGKFPQGHPRLAEGLNNLGSLLHAQGKSARALDYFQEALAMRQRLYSKAQYPQGHPDLATNLNNLGSLLQEQGEYGSARDYFQQALTMYQALYPKTKYPHGHPDLATSLNSLGFLLKAQGEYAHSWDFFQRALAIRQRLYPKAKYPQGHPHLAQSLNNLGLLLQAQGEYAHARDYYQHALAMYERLYPKAKYPKGHPDLAASLNGLANLYLVQGQYTKAEPLFQRSLKMGESTLGKDHPDVAESLNKLAVLYRAQGEYDKAESLYQRCLKIWQSKLGNEHHHVASSLNNLGGLRENQGNSGAALGYYKRAFAMFQRLYPKEKYPNGHPDLVLSLSNVGAVLQARGEYAKAVTFYKQALEMCESLYPKQKFPQGHPDLANALHNLGTLLCKQQKYPQALEYYKRALQMRYDLADIFLSVASEGQAFHLADSLPFTRDALLSATRLLPKTTEDTYSSVWYGKAAVTWYLERRLQDLAELLSSSEQSSRAKQAKARKLWGELLAVRRQLSVLLLPAGRHAQLNRKYLEQLTKSKEDLEKQLARLLPCFARRHAFQRKGHEDPGKALPKGTVYIDIFHYIRFEQDPKRPGDAGERRTPCYVAFVLHRGQPLERVELNEAAPINRAVAGWRTEIQEKKEGQAAQALRRLVWQPLARRLPADVHTVYLAAEGDLVRLPWAPLPINKKGRRFLENYALAIVPHGPFLLERLREASRVNKEAQGMVLAVGGVNYDDKPEIGSRERGADFHQTPEWGEHRRVWNYLPGTLHELDMVLERAGKRQALGLSGAKASTTRLVAELPQARWVHLATHGFFADKQFRSILQIDEQLFDRRSFRAGPPLGARNPLVLSGLVLAGANMPLPKDLKGRTESDGGILTAEAIAGLPLHRLELAVLSACETGLGEVAGGEGVFSLQRAFHLAGARNVVASLWKVDDRTTAALMALFYDKLWSHKKSALVALREAQLTLYHHPERIAALAKERGPNFDKVVRLPITPDKETKPSPKGKAATKLWAGFVLSGLGR
jgi:tetratricopeptide (TPR) repeat protein/CHAT domain-containing protein